LVAQSVRSTLRKSGQKDRALGDDIILVSFSLDWQLADISR